ncbi:MAG: hypothetical protein ACK4GJ_00240 [bacterium]
MIKKFFSVIMSVFLILFCIIFINSFAIDLETGKKFLYKDTIESYIDDTKEVSIDYIFDVNVKPVGDRNYDFEVRLKSIVFPANLNEETYNLLRIFTNGFVVNFTVDKNMDLIYSPNFEFLYKSNPLYKKYKDKIDEDTFKDFAKSVFYSFFDWFGKLKKSGNIDFVKYSALVEYDIYYDSQRVVDLNLSKKRYKANFQKGMGRVTKISGKDNMFDIFNIQDGRIYSYEYFELYGNFPLLFQRKIDIKMSINDPNFKAKYVQKYGKDTINYKINRTLSLIYAN